MLQLNAPYIATERSIIFRKKQDLNFGMTAIYHHNSKVSEVCVLS